MILRNLGSGHQFAKYPQAPPCFTIQTNDSVVAIGCPAQFSLQLERYGMDINDITMILPLDTSISQIGGLDEIGFHFANKKKKPFLACPADLLGRVLGRLEYPSGFQPKAVTRIGLKEDHVSESISFVHNYRDNTSFGIRLEEAKIFITGRCDVNEDWLFREMGCEVILHYDMKELIDLPVYLQSKIWIYGYDGKDSFGNDPVPMLYLPQGEVVFDSDRKFKMINKERHIKTISSKILGRESKK